ncbi:hypothetical protein [Streptomyces sp. V4I2]|uniref:hypothetical protein n=1 Tax=Streptomyces sp. V4I2 TaxID=3042280 RepID=UPI00278B1588|nr:hypothetical protein [Streptomyces sp. V4I2]MDQ1041781.1 hypothetical protein [Streptomyces sp. V4I2]
MTTAVNTRTRYNDTGRAMLVPLLVDPATNRGRNLDLEVTPHLLISGYTGWGATSALRLVAAHTARHGIDVQVLDPCPKRVGFTGLEDVGPFVTVHRDLEDVLQAVTDFVTGFEIRFEELDGRAPESHRLLVVDGLERLRKSVVGDGADRCSVLDALEPVLTLGRAVGYHVAASVSQSFAARRHFPRAFKDCSALLNLGPTTSRARTELLGAGPRPAGVPAGRGGGEFADYDGLRAVRTVFVSEDEAREIARG